MLPEIAEIKAYRKRMGLTQTELSRLCNVSQSLIAKMESGQIIPSYDKVKRIFEALEQAQKKNCLKARDIMSKRVKFVRASHSARKAVSIMQKNGFSQVPVIKRDKCIGVITERIALSALRKLGQKKFNSAKASEIMEDPLPIVSDQALFPLLVGILNHEQALLVSRKGKIVGIITKSDLLKSVLTKP